MASWVKVDGAVQNFLENAVLEPKYSDFCKLISVPSRAGIAQSVERSLMEREVSRSTPTQCASFRYVERDWLGSHAGCQEVSRCSTQSLNLQREHVMLLRYASAKYWIRQNPLWLWNPDGDVHQKSKTGVSVAPQKGLMSSKNFFLKKKKKLISDQACFWTKYSLTSSLPTEYWIDMYCSRGAWLFKVRRKWTVYLDDLMRDPWFWEGKYWW